MSMSSVCRLLLCHYTRLHIRNGAWSGHLLAAFGKPPLRQQLRLGLGDDRIESGRFRMISCRRAHTIEDILGNTRKSHSFFVCFCDHMGSFLYRLAMHFGMIYMLLHSMSGVEGCLTQVTFKMSLLMMMLKSIRPSISNSRTIRSTSIRNHRFNIRITIIIIKTMSAPLAATGGMTEITLSPSEVMGMTLYMFITKGSFNTLQRIVSIKVRSRLNFVNIVSL
mmetsp:Transcript_30558/g.51614  ORF Transcript_30558/g.51614 Transcript_30558/m.51614 type:complete len:222 (+) Transcript_30558:1235-1900(+)